MAARGRSLLHRDMMPEDAFDYLFPYNVEELHRVENDAEDRSAGHDVKENLLFGGLANETVHRVWTGTLVAAEQHGQLETVENIVEDEQGAHLKSRLKNQTSDVGEKQSSVNGRFVLVQLFLVLGLTVLPVGHVQGHQQGRGRDQDELHGPEAHLRDGEEVVEAGGLAARLAGVAHKLLHLVLPHLLGCRDVHQDSEEEDDGEPDAPDRRGVFVHAAEDVLQKAPVHFGRRGLRGRCEVLRQSSKCTHTLLTENNRSSSGQLEAARIVHFGVFLSTAACVRETWS